jgi:hypothetical protein
MVCGLTAPALAPVAFALASLREPAQRQPGEMGFGDRNPLGALGQAATPAFPALGGKVRQGAAGGAARVTALHVERTHKSGARRSLVEAKAAHPFFHDLRIAQFGQPLQQILAGLAKMAPFRVWVQVGEAFSERPAAAKSNAQIVNGRDAEPVRCERLFGSDAAQRAFERTRRKRKIC